MERLELTVYHCIGANGIGLGEGGLVGCSILAGCFCPLLPNPCYKLGGYSSENLIRNDKQKI